ncbi:hypothetical protein CA51_45140 [Rosistilla oblonga]|nr:hypothetical protein CA51_45140 [Rosistilla oblonga]
MAIGFDVWSRRSSCLPATLVGSVELTAGYTLR